MKFEIKHDTMKKIIAIYRLVEKMNEDSDELNSDVRSESNEAKSLNKRGRFLYSRRSFDDDQIEKSLLLAKRRFLKSKRSVM